MTAIVVDHTVDEERNGSWVCLGCGTTGGWYDWINIADPEPRPEVQAAAREAWKKSQTVREHTKLSKALRA